MSVATTQQFRVNVARAKAIMATEPVGTERYALANSIVSLEAAVRALTNENECLLEDNERLRRELDEERGVIR